MESNKEILIVDDDCNDLLLLKKVLEKHGYVVVSAEGVGAALVIIKEDPHRFNLVLTDLCMPDFGDGFRLCKEVKKINPGILVLLLTGAPEEALENPMASAVDGCLGKPLTNLEVLASEIGKHAA